MKNILTHTNFLAKRELTTPPCNSHVLSTTLNGGRTGVDTIVRQPLSAPAFSGSIAVVEPTIEQPLSNSVATSRLVTNSTVEGHSTLGRGSFEGRSTIAIGNSVASSPTHRFTDSPIHRNLKKVAMLLCVLLLGIGQMWGAETEKLVCGFETESAWGGSNISNRATKDDAPRTGNKYLYGTGSSGNGRRFTSSNIAMTKNKYYHVIMWVKSDVNATCGIGIGGAASAYPFEVSAGTWTQISLAYQATGTSNKTLNPTFTVSASAKFYVDDVICYESDDKSSTDLDAPSVPTSASATTSQISWTKGSDGSGTGVQATLIFRRTSGTARDLALNNQGIYASSGKDQSQHWTLIEIKDKDATSYSGTFTAGDEYAIVHRDLAYNYSTPAYVTVSGASSTYTATIQAGSNGEVDVTSVPNLSGSVIVRSSGDKLTVGTTEITATPANGYELDNWTVGSATLAIGGSTSISAATTITANFKPSGGGDCTTPTASWATEPTNLTVGTNGSASITTNYAAGVVWSSSNPSVATISGNGTAATITPVVAGTTTITATVTGDGTNICTGPAIVTREITVSGGVTPGPTPSGGTIFSLEMNTSVTDKSFTNLENLTLTSDHATIKGGTVTMVCNGGDGKLQIKYSEIYFNGSDPYVQVTLNNALKEGDKLEFTSVKGASNQIYLTNAATKPGTSNILTSSLSYTIKSGDDLDGKSIFYFWRKSNSTYIKTLTITRSASSDATLSDLKVNGSPIPGFVPSTTSYNATLEAPVNDVTIVGTPNDENAKSVVVTPPTGDKKAGTYTITVTAENGTTTKTYTVNVTINVTITTAVNNSYYGSVSASLSKIAAGTSVSTNGATLTIDGKTITATANPQTDQYTYAFDSWSWSPELANNQIGESNLTVTANFTRTTRQYGISAGIKSGEESYGSLNPTQLTSPVDYGTSIFVDETDNKILHVGTQTITATPTPTTAQYTYAFSGWSWTPEGSTITAATTATASFTRSACTYNINYILDGGSWNGAEPSNTYTYGTGVPTLPTNVQRTGYTFDGWFDNSGLTGEPITAIANTATGDKEFWAKWTASIPNFSMVVTATSHVSQSSVATKTDVDIATKGWATVQNGSAYMGHIATGSTSVEVDQVSKVYGYKLGDEKHYLKVVLNAPLGPGSVIAMTSPTAYQYYLTPTNDALPTSSAITTSNLAYTVQEGDALVGKTTFYVWRAESANTILHSINVSATAAPDVWSVYFGDDTNGYTDYTLTNGSVTIDNLAKETTYQFKVKTNGATETWYTDQNEGTMTESSCTNWSFSKTDGNNTKLTTAAAGSYTINVNTSGATPLVSVVYPASYSITFNGNGADDGTMTTINHIAANEQVQLPAKTFTKSCNDFDKWNTESDGSGMSYTDGDNITVTGNMTLYAQWKVARYQAIYDANGVTGFTGELPAPVAYDCGSRVTIDQSQTLSKFGYTFVGWNTNSAATTPQADAENPFTIEHDTRIYAIWSAKKPTGIAIAPASGTYQVTKGTGVQMNVTLTPDASELAEENRAVTWSTSNSTFASVNQNGYVSFVGVGSVTITATSKIDGSVSGNYTFSVSAGSCVGWEISAWDEGVGNGTMDYFYQVGSTDEWRVKYILPNGTRKFWVGNCEGFGGHSKNWDFGWIRLKDRRDKGCDNNTQYAGQDAVGELVIWSNSDAENYGVAFLPNYKVSYMTDASTWRIMDFHSTSTQYAYETDIFQVPAGYYADANMKYYVGVEKSNGDNMTIDGISSQDPMKNVNGLSRADLAGKFGKWHIWSNSCDNNWYCEFNRYYQVRFEMNDGDGNIDPMYFYGDNSQSFSTGTLTNPTRTGYTLTGWKDQDNATYGLNQSITVTKDLVLTAQWSINQYNVSWVTDGETLTGDYTKGSVNFGTVIVKPETPTKTGYTFKEWTPAVETTVPAHNVEYTATWTINQYNVSWVTDGDDLTGGYTNGSVNFGTTIVAPNTPTKTGYTFAAWSPAVDATVPAHDVEYTATWNLNNYGLTFNLDGGSGYSDQSVAYGAQVDVSTAPTKTGYTFNGWTTSDVTITDGKFIMPAKSVTLTATWTANHYTVTLVDYDGNNSSADIVVAYDSVCPSDQIEKLTISKTGYDFDGFGIFDGVNYENYIKLDGGTYKFEGTKAGYTESQKWVRDGGATFTAKWNVHNKSITWQGLDDAEIVTGTTPANANYGATITLPTVSKTGYNFTGWTIAPTVTVTDGTFTMPDNNLTITANWTINSYTVSFNLQGHGTAIDNQTIDYNGTVTRPTDPTATGYDFGGWYKENTCQNEWNFDNDKVTAATELFANWTAKTIQITFNANGGKFSDESTSKTLDYIYDGEALTLPTPTNEPLTFDGWYDAATGGNKITEVGTDNKPAENTIYYAHWQKATPVVTWNGNEDMPSGSLGQRITFTVTTTSDADLTNALKASSGTLKTTVSGQTITAELACPTTAGDVTITLSTTATDEFNSSTKTATISVSACATTDEKLFEFAFKKQPSAANADSTLTYGSMAWDALQVGRTASLTSNVYAKFGSNNKYLDCKPTEELKAGDKIAIDYMCNEAAGSATIIITPTNSITAIYTCPSYGKEGRDVELHTEYVVEENDGICGTQVVRFRRTNSNGLLHAVTITRKSTKYVSPDLTWADGTADKGTKNKEFDPVTAANNTFAMAATSESAGTISYTSSATDVATIDEDGNVTMTSKGGTTILTASVTALGCYKPEQITCTLKVALPKIDKPIVSIATDGSQSECAGDESELGTITATPLCDVDGASFTYAWYKDNAVIEDATDATYQPQATGIYTCKVTASKEGYTSVTSDAPTGIEYTVVALPSATEEKMTNYILVTSGNGYEFVLSNISNAETYTLTWDKEGPEAVAEPTPRDGKTTFTGSIGYTPGNYTGTLTFFNSLGCPKAYTLTLNVTVTMTPPEVNTPATICADGASVLTFSCSNPPTQGTGEKFYWQTEENGTSIEHENEITSPAADGTYTYYVRCYNEQYGIFGKAVSCTGTIQPTLVPSTLENAFYLVNATDVTALDATAEGGDGEYDYQWKSSTDNTNWEDIQGATNATYTPSTDEHSTIYYRCQVTSGVCEATTNVAEVEVCGHYPTITAPTADQELTVAQGETVFLQVEAAPSDDDDEATPLPALSYQWYKEQDGDDEQVGTNSSVYSFEANGNADTYYCVVSEADGCYDVKSPIFTITVTDGTPQCGRYSEIIGVKITGTTTCETRGDMYGDSGIKVHWKDKEYGKLGTNDNYVYITIKEGNTFYATDQLNLTLNALSNTSDRLYVFAGTNAANDPFMEILNTEFSNNKVSVPLTGIPANTTSICLYRNDTYKQNPCIADMSVSRETCDEGAMAFVAAKDNNWSDPANWIGTTNPAKELPTIGTITQIKADVTVSEKDAQAARVDLCDNSTLTIAPTGGLNVAGKVQHEDGSATAVSDITIQSTAAGNGALVFNNNDGQSAATVQLYSKAYSEKNDAGKTLKYWQYIGMPTYVDDVLNVFEGASLYRYHENSGWEKISAYHPAFSWYGYGVSYSKEQEKQATYTFAGELVKTTTKEITLTKTAEVGKGANMVANSWTAPINIRQFDLSDFDGAEATIYIFNTGRDRAEYGGEATFQLTDEEEAGQWSTYPINTVKQSGWQGATTIASLQAFQVNVAEGEESATLTLDYDRLVRPATGNSIGDNVMRAPARTAEVETEPEMIWMRVADTNTRADIYLLQRNDFSANWDNGWDGSCFDGDGRSPMFYSVSDELGKMTVQATDDWEGTAIGFAPAKAMVHTISFDYNGTAMWYLNDIKEQKSTLIDAANTYTFTSEEGDGEARFYLSQTPFRQDISTRHNEIFNKGNQVHKIIYREHMYVIINGQLYDGTGKLVKRQR